MAILADSMRRYGGMYGKAFKNGKILADLVEVSGNIEVAKIQVPLVGTTKQGYKAGRESREGSIKIQKIDAAWEIDLLNWLKGRQEGLTESGKRTNTDSHVFDLQIVIDDPEAYDYESWQLLGCQIWRVPLGFSITDDIIDRELPFTWESETLIHAPNPTGDGQLGVQSRNGEWSSVSNNPTR